MKFGKGSYGFILAFAAAALVFPLVTQNGYLLTVASYIFIMAIATAGLNLLAGYAGQLNLAHGGFMAIGAYGVGILTTDYAFSFWSAAAIACFVSGCLGVLVGLISLRLRGHYFSIFTLCIGYIMYLIVEKWDGLTHGTLGIRGIAAPAAPMGIDLSSPTGMYYLSLAALAVALWTMHRIVRSLLGWAFVAVRNSEDLAEAVGINLMRTKLTAFVLSVVYAAIAGALYAGQIGFIGPEIANETVTFDMLMFALVGGLGTLIGPVLGAIVIGGLSQWLQVFQDYRMLVFGPLLIVLVIYLPDGVMGAWRKRLPGRKQDERIGSTRKVDQSKQSDEKVQHA